MKLLLSLLSLLSLIACQTGTDKPSPVTGGTDIQTGGTGTDSAGTADTRVTDTAPISVEAQCALVCDRYAECGCEERCSDWCASCDRGWTPG